MDALNTLAGIVLDFSVYTQEKRKTKPIEAVIKLCAAPTRIDFGSLLCGLVGGCTANPAG